MKIGIQTEAYSGIVTFEINTASEKVSIFELLLTAKSCNKDEVDMIIKVKEDKNKNQTNE